MKRKSIYLLLIIFTACSVFENEWDKALKEGNRTSFVNYIKNNPQSENLLAAKAKIDSLDWSLFYILVPMNPQKDKILSKGYFIPNTNMMVEVSTLSILPQKPCSISEIRKIFGEPDTLLLNPEVKYLFVVDDIGKIFGGKINITLDDGTTTYGVNVFHSDINGPGVSQADNSVYNVYQGNVARYGRFDLLLEQEGVKQIVINFAHGSLTEEKIDTTSYDGWRVINNSADAVFLSPFISWLTLINKSDSVKIFAENSVRK